MRTSLDPSSARSPTSGGSFLTFLLTGPRIQTAFLSLATHLPTSFHCRKPRASEVPARTIRSWLPNDHLDEGFSGELMRAFAHRSGSSFEEKSPTIFSSSAFARSLQEAWGEAIATAAFASSTACASASLSATEGLTSPY